MIDEKLYRETFSRLRASDEAKQEVIMRTADMNEKKTRRPLKALRAAAIAAMLTVALAVTADGRDVDVTVTGTLEDCEVQLSSRDGDTEYHVAAESSAAAESYTSVVTTTVTD